MLKLAVCLLLLIALGARGAQCELRNLVLNPSFEEDPGKSGLPQGWYLWEQDPGQVQCAIDNSVSHSGAKSMRMIAGKDAYSLMVAPKMPIAEGEKFEVSIWVKTKDFVASSGEGMVVFSAAFLRPDGRFLSFKRLGRAVPSGEWQKISGEAVVPGEVSDMTLEVGIKNAHGTVWFDDVSIISKSPYSIRPSGKSTEIPPGASVWSLDIINREKAARSAIVRAEIGKATFSQNVQLDGSDIQKIELPIIAGAPTKGSIKLQILDKASGAVLGESVKEMRVVDAVEMEPLVPTHFCIEDGKPSLEARIWNHIPSGNVADANISLKDSAGKVLDSKTLSPVKAGYQDIQLSSDKAGLGDYSVEMTLKSKDGKTYSASQPWHIIHRSQARVTFNDAGFTVADGKPIFPLGTFNSGRYELMKTTGFTVTHAWNRMKLAQEGDRTNNQLAKDYLDDTQEAGMKAIGFLHVAYMERQDWDELRRRIRMFRNHPALLAWDQEEGVARDEVKLPALEKLAKIVREEDPNHPFVLADSYDEITKVDRSRFFKEDIMDGGMWWYYPIPMDLKGISAALEGQDATTGLIMSPPSFLFATKKPVWVGLQAYAKPRPGGRIPTDAEYRCMAYLSVIHGAKGLIYYMGGSAWIVDGADESSPWGYLHKLIPELSEMAPVFMAQTAPDKVSISPSTAAIDTLFKLDNGIYTLIAVNRNEKDTDATLKISVLNSGTTDVLFENRTLPVKSGQLSDHFSGYGVHIYRWKKV